MTEDGLPQPAAERNEDFTGSFCLLHTLTRLYPTYYEILVDVADYDLVASITCGMRRVASGRRLDIYYGGLQLGRFLMGSPRGSLVDHRNRNPLDNRRANLRACTYRQNNVNSARQHGGSSQYRGVYRTKRGRWYAQAGTRDERVFLGSFASEVEAALAYNRFAREKYGEFAFQNPV